MGRPSQGGHVSQQHPGHSPQTPPGVRPSRHTHADRAHRDSTQSREWSEGEQERPEPGLRGYTPGHRGTGEPGLREVHSEGPEGWGARSGREGLRSSHGGRPDRSSMHSSYSPSSSRSPERKKGRAMSLSGTELAPDALDPAGELNIATSK
eukprot:1175752-Prorocentrum_minimum.AAC.2